MLEVKRYESIYKPLWDEFIGRSKNALFLFYRDYMDYHADRFIDHSLMVFDGKKLIGVLPANIKDGVMASHGGLTFGGFLSDRHMKAALMLDVFSAVMQFCRSKGICKILYKAIPYIYHDIPAQEDLYALFRNRARLIRRDISSCIDLTQPVCISRGRKTHINRAKKTGMTVCQNTDFLQFMHILTTGLKEKYNVKPPHTLSEIECLAGRFPKNIKLYSSYLDNDMLAGVIIFESRHVAHAQYTMSSSKGKSCNALDILFDNLINEVYVKKKSYFDFGISTEREGLFLNENLIFFKEGFGARALVHDFYELDL